ncbi:unnamed protein product [Penicillium bialowiezense]
MSASVALTPQTGLHKPADNRTPHRTQYAGGAESMEIPAVLELRGLSYDVQAVSLPRPALHDEWFLRIMDFTTPDLDIFHQNRDARQDSELEEQRSLLYAQFMTRADDHPDQAVLEMAVEELAVEHDARQ